MLNDKQVRNQLAQKGIVIPDTTYVIAAEHITTTDKIMVHRNAIPESHIGYVNDLERDSNEISGSTIVKNADSDWAQVRPEWGLARNASLIIGPRWLTQNIDLKGRAFLHSYECKQDKNGALLATIFSGPGLVAHAINTQYLFSTLNNTYYGAGSKVTSTVVGNIGTMQGNGSDLMGGLPLQSIYITDNIPYHIPQRLLIVVYSTQETVNQALEQSPEMKLLLQGKWLRLLCIDPETHVCIILAT
jgi:uncharacterized protein YbcC (UPF0753/DUF2309 family)